MSCCGVAVIVVVVGGVVRFEQLNMCVCVCVMRGLLRTDTLFPCVVATTPVRM